MQRYTRDPDTSRQKPSPLEVGTAWLARRIGLSEVEALAALDAKRLARDAFYIGCQLQAVNDQERKLIEHAARLRGAC